MSVAGNEDLANQLGEMIVVCSTVRDSDLAKITAKNQETADQIQSSFSEHLKQTFNESKPSIWDYMLYSMSEGRFDNPQEVMEKRIREDITEPLAESFKTCFGRDLYAATEEATGEIAAGFSSDASTASMATGMKSVSDTLVSEFIRNQGLDSDSSVMGGLGSQTVMSLSMGIGAKQSDLELTASNLSTGILNGVSSLPTDMQTNGQNITNGFLSGLSGLNRDTDSKLSNLSSKFSNWSATLKTPHLSWDMNGLQTSGILKTILETLNLPTTLPKLSVSWYAQGGIFNSPRIIGVGERGPEAVVPLSENAEWIESLASKIAQRGAQIANTSIPERYDNSGGDWTFILQRADGTTEGEVTITAADRMNQSHGEMKIPMYV